MPNPVVHFEILAGPGTDKARLQRFYAEAFGWQVDAGNPMGYGLVGAQEDRGIGGGIDDHPEGPRVTVYVEAQDLKAAVAQVQKSGATIVQDITTIPGMVTYALFRDPAGNIVGIVDAAVPPAP